MPTLKPVHEHRPARASVSTPFTTRVAGLILVLSTVAVPVNPAGAQSVYMWEDDAGIQHFSDRKPVGDYAVTEQRAVAEPESPVEMRDVGVEREPEWQFSNRLHGPVTVEVHLPEAENLISEPEVPARLELPARGERSVLLGPLDPAAGWRYRIEMRAVPGSLDPTIDTDFEYRAPVEAGTALRVGQGFGGGFSHQQPQSRYAVDFDLPVGTPIVAARGGRVMDVARYFHRAGQDLGRDGPRANYVRILHDDGSMAVYAHLDYQGVLVRPGQQIEAGHAIGRSGNTGFSTGPHLHFAVQVNRDMELVSAPFTMLDHDGQVLKLQ